MNSYESAAFIGLACSLALSIASASGMPVGHDVLGAQSKSGRYETVLAEAERNLQSGSFTKALKLAETAVSLDSKRYEAYYVIGVVQLHDDSLRLSSESIGKALKYAPKEKKSGLRNLLANIRKGKMQEELAVSAKRLFENGEFGFAANQYMKTWLLSPDHFGYGFLAASAWNIARDYERSMRVLILLAASEDTSVSQQALLRLEKTVALYYISTQTAVKSQEESLADSLAQNGGVQLLPSGDLDALDQEILADRNKMENHLATLEQESRQKAQDVASKEDARAFFDNLSAEIDKSLVEKGQKPMDENTRKAVDAGAQLLGTDVGEGEYDGQVDLAISYGSYQINELPNYASTSAELALVTDLRLVLTRTQASFLDLSARGFMESGMGVDQSSNASIDIYGGTGILRYWINGWFAPFAWVEYRNYTISREKGDYKIDRTTFGPGVAIGTWSKKGFFFVSGRSTIGGDKSYYAAELEAGFNLFYIRAEYGSMKSSYPDARLQNDSQLTYGAGVRIPF